MPWRRIPERDEAPWIGCDPALRSDCSGAYRAFRLTILALFAFVGTSNQGKAQSEPFAAKAAIKTETGFPAMRQIIVQVKVLRTERTLRSRGLTPDAVPDIQGFPDTMAVDQRKSALLTVKRTHGPPAGTNLFGESITDFLSARLNGLLLNPDLEYTQPAPSAPSYHRFPISPPTHFYKPSLPEISSNPDPGVDGRYHAGERSLSNACERLFCFAGTKAPARKRSVDDGRESPCEPPKLGWEQKQNFQQGDTV